MIDTTKSADNYTTKEAALSTLKKVMAQLKVKDKVEIVETKRVVKDILKTVLRERNLVSSLSKVKSFSDYTFEHSVNVCMFSLLLGLHLQMSREELGLLGMAALLHDIGMQQVDKDIICKREALSSEELLQVQKHPYLGYEALTNKKYFPEEVAMAIWQHHERLDGSGYPCGLQGNKISRFAQILAVADVFDALISDRPFRNAFYPHQAVSVLVNSKGQFASDVMQAFLDKVIIYPINTRVELNSGEKGIVVDMNKGSHASPVVRFETVGNEHRLTCKEVDLSKHEDLYIVRILKDEFG